MIRAATTAAPPDSVWTVFLQFGALGGIAILAAIGAIAVWRSQERRISRLEDLLAQERREKDELMRQTLPVLTRSVEVMSEVVEETRRERRS